MGNHFALSLVALFLCANALSAQANRSDQVQAVPITRRVLDDISDHALVLREYSSSRFLLLKYYQRFAQNFLRERGRKPSRSDVAEWIAEYRRECVLISAGIRAGFDRDTRVAEIVGKMEKEILSSPTGPYANIVRNSWFAKDQRGKSGTDFQEWRDSVLQASQLWLNEGELSRLASVAEEGGFSLGEIPEQLTAGKETLYEWALDGVMFTVSTGEFLDNWRTGFVRPVFRNRKNVVDYIELVVWKEVNGREAVKAGVPLMPLFIEEKAGFQRYQILEQCRLSWRKPEGPSASGAGGKFAVPFDVLSGTRPARDVEVQSPSDVFVVFESERALVQRLVDQGEILADFPQSTIDFIYAADLVE